MKHDPLIIIQARLNSKRLPRKILLPIDGKPIIEHVIERCRQAAHSVLAIPMADSRDREFRDLIERLQIKWTGGSETDVLQRFYQTARTYAVKSAMLVRITADCPMIDPQLIRDVMELKRQTKRTIVGTATGWFALKRKLEKLYPDGLDVEAFNYETLQNTHKCGVSTHTREHVTPLIWNTSTYAFLAAPADHRHLKWSVDTEEDYKRVKRLMEQSPGVTDWKKFL